MAKRVLSCIALLLILASASAQDIIVKHDDSTIVAKVKKIGTSEIEYVKFNNQEGPVYVIEKKDVKVINYENGTRDTFAVPDPAANASTTAYSTKGAPSAANASLVADFNSGEVRYTGKKTDKDAGYLIYQFKLADGSVLENDDLTVEIIPVKFREEGGKMVSYKTSEKLGGWSSNDGYYFSLLLMLNNRTDKDIYVDLGASNIIRNGVASSLYEYTVNTRTHSVTGAGGVSTSVLGIGIGMASASTTTNSETVVNKRVIQIPPHSKVYLPYIELGKDFRESAARLLSTQLKDARGYEVKGRNMGTMSAIGLHNGEKVEFEDGASLLSLSYDLNYGFAEAGPFNRSIDAKLILSSIIGTEDNKSILKFDATEFPTNGFYFYFLNYFDKKTLRK